jgi:hypothetical protein
MIYLFLNDTTMGPYSLASVEELWRQGMVTGFTQCCQEGSDQWLPLASVMAAPAKSGVQAHSQPVTAEERTTKEIKSKVNLLATFAALVLFCFPWMEVQCSGKPMATQSGVQAVYGGASLSDQMNNFVGSKNKAADKPDLGTAYLAGAVLLITALAAWSSFIVFRGGRIPPGLIPERLCALAILLLTAQVAIGFPAEKRMEEASDKMHEKKPGDDEFSSSIASAMTGTMNFGVRFTPALYGEFLALGVPALFMLNGWLNKMKKPA